MIDRDHDLSITKQAKVLHISRGTVYYRPRPVSDVDTMAGWEGARRIHLGQGLVLAGKERRNRKIQRLCHLGQPAAADAIGALFILLNLLKCHPKFIRQLGLRHLKLKPTQPDSFANGNVDGIRSSGLRSAPGHWLFYPSEEREVRVGIARCGDPATSFNSGRRKKVAVRGIDMGSHSRCQTVRARG